MVIIMALTSSQVASLQTAIESAISNISMVMEEWSHRDIVKMNEIDNINDFVYGYIMGLASNAFFYIIFISEGRTPSKDELAESKMILSEWIPKIRRTISIERYRIRMSS